MKRLSKKTTPDTSTTDLTLPPGNFLANVLGQPAPTTTIEPSEGGNFVPYVSFYSGREGARGGSLTAADIANAVPGISRGAPYYRAGDALGAVSTVVLVDLFTFYGKRNADNEVVQAAAEKGVGLREAAIALLLVVDGDEVFPAICETSGKAKSNALFKMATDQQANGRGRQARLSGVAKSFTNDEGEDIEYTQTLARCGPVDSDVAAKLAKFGADPANEERLIAAQEEFRRRKDVVIELQA